MAKGKSPPKDKLEREIEGAMARLQSPSSARAGVVQLVHREGDAAPPILVYDTPKGARIELRFDGAEPWVTQAQLAAMFGVSLPTVNEHIQKYLADGELDDSVIRKFRITAADGKSYETNHYGMDVAFYVGYRVNSRQGAVFRRWATDVLVRFATHGYAMDVERLKAPDDPSVVDELKEIIRDIRSSTQNVYREVRKIVSLCQDYDGRGDIAHAFYARMENKLLYIATSKTAPELIVERADASKPDMGLTCYTGKRGPTQADAKIANNYLAEGEARVKNRATVMLLDYFEEQVDQGRLVTMDEAEEKLDGFIRFNNWPLLRSSGRVSRSDADDHAVKQQKLLKSQ